MLTAGQTITLNFEDALDSRWHVEGAAASAEQFHGGKKSLKLIQGQSALLRFGGDDDLPVKISFWMFDNGKKLGNKTATGGAWGVKTADGDTFALRTCWRTYHDGDSDYAWFNTGEMEWFSPHPASIPRIPGWSEWVFDFTDRANPKMTGGGKAVDHLIPKYLPHGAVALFFCGGDGDAGPLYIDDINVEFLKSKQ